jgi:hypothetical protein
MARNPHHKLVVVMEPPLLVCLQALHGRRQQRHRLHGQPDHLHPVSRQPAVVRGNPEGDAEKPRLDRPARVEVRKAAVHAHEDLVHLIFDLAGPDAQAT